MIHQPTLTPKWYALSVYSRQENAAIEHVNAMGIELFFPQQIVRRAWSDRVKSLKVPLFPGYLFVRVALNASVRIELIRRKQILDFVGKKKNYLGEELAYCVPEYEIESVRKLISQKEMVEPLYGLIQGQWVEVISGPLKGVFGTIHKLPDGKRQISVNVTILGRRVCAALSADDVIAARSEDVALAA